MNVYHDYRNRQWSPYFTKNFTDNHLRPFYPVPLDGHKGARVRAREGNVSLNGRIQQNANIYLSSIIYDLDLKADGPRQVLQLMNEVASRNAEKYYERDDVKGKRVETLQPYYIQTTGHGSRNGFIYQTFFYKVAKEESNGRFLICHYDGAD